VERMQKEACEKAHSKKGVEMKIYEHPNMLNFKCPICGTAADKPVTLVPISGTIEQNGLCEANQYHIDCLELWERHEDNCGHVSQVFDRKDVAKKE